MPWVGSKLHRAKIAVESAAQLAPEELETLNALHDAESPLSSVEIAYKLALLPHEADERLTSLESRELVATKPVSDGEPVRKVAGKVFELTESGRVALSAADLLAASKA